MDLADNSHKCVCNDSYTGPFCETFIDACHANPCKNGAVCESRRTDYTCHCKPGINYPFEGWDFVSVNKKSYFCTIYLL